MAIEIERKFRIEAGAEVPDLSSVVVLGEVRRLELNALYFDTPDLTLARQRITLRRRAGGTDQGWHLKLPRSGDSREEIHHPSPQLGSVTVPLELRRQVQKFIGYAPLIPVVQLETLRLESDLLDKKSDTKKVALLCDDTVTATRNGSKTTWRELEVELVGDDEDLLDRIATALGDAGVTPAESVSKLVQALGESFHQQTRPVGRKSSAAEVIGSYLAAQVGVILGRESEVREDAPDAVHKMRVGTRRLRSALKTFRSLLDTEALGDLRDEIKWLAEMLGGPRDAEVLRERLHEALEQVPEHALVGPVDERIKTELSQRHDATHRELVVALGSVRYRSLTDRLVDLAANPPFREVASARAKGLLPDVLERIGRRTLKEWKRAERASGEEQLLGWHETRKRAKATRYAWEACIPALGEPAEAAAAAWEGVTESLGVVQDTAVARERLLELADAATAAGEPTFSYGVLYQRELDRTADFHEKAVAAIAEARKVGVGV